MSPALKLVGLLVKTIAKPVANRMKSEAAKHPNFTKFCVGVGQGMHQLSAKVNVISSGYKFVGVKSLSEEAALSDGIGYVSEFVVFSVAGVIIVIEVSIVYCLPSVLLF